MPKTRPTKAILYSWACHLSECNVQAVYVYWVIVKYKAKAGEAERQTNPAFDQLCQWCLEP